jgi:hypothetical protein
MKEKLSVKNFKIASIYFAKEKVGNEFILLCPLSR